MRPSALWQIMMLFVLLSCGRNHHGSASHLLDEGGDQCLIGAHEVSERCSGESSNSPSDSFERSNMHDRYTNGRSDGGHYIEFFEADVVAPGADRPQSGGPLTREASERLDKGSRNLPSASRNYRWTTKSVSSQDVERLKEEITRDKARFADRVNASAAQAESGTRALVGALAEAQAKHNEMVTGIKNAYALDLGVNPSGQEFKTPLDTPEGKKLSQARSYRNYVAAEVAKDTGSNRAIRQNMIEMADVNLHFADDSYYGRSIDHGDFYRETALRILDATLTFTPVVGTGYDVYQILTGKAVTGATLSDGDRAVILATMMMPVVVGPTLRYLKKGLQELESARPIARELRSILEKFDLMPQLEKMGLSDAKTIRDNADVIRSVPSHATNVRAVSTTPLNAENAARIPGYQKAYNDGKIAIEYVSGETATFGRAYGDIQDNMAGHWVADMRDLKGRTATEIKQDFALQSVPSNLSKATVPAGTPMRSSSVGVNDWGGNPNKIQYEVRLKEVPDEWFARVGDIK